MTRSNRWLLLGLGVLSVATTFLFSSPARAQDQSGQANQALVDKIVQMNKRALDDYDTLEWDSAKRTLLEALVAGKKAGLDNHPVMARTYVHLGCVYVTGVKDRQKGVQSFIRALEIDPSVRIERTMTDPTSRRRSPTPPSRPSRARAPSRRRRPRPSRRRAAAAEAARARHGGQLGARQAARSRHGERRAAAAAIDGLGR